MDVVELVRAVELVDVRCIEFVADLKIEAAIGLPETLPEGTPGADSEVELDVNPIQWGRRIEVWFRITLENKAALLRSAYAVIYKRDSEDEIPEGVRREFIERVAIMAAVPYLRESIQQAALRIQVPAPLIPILRQGQFQLRGALSDEEATEDSEPE